MWGFNEARTRVGPAIGLPAGSTPAEAVWTAESDEYHSLLEYPPSIAYGMLYYCTNGADHGGEVVALELATGKVMWRFRVRGQFASQPAVCNDTVYVGTMPEKPRFHGPKGVPKLLALRAQPADPSKGELQLLASRKVVSAIESSPLVVGSRVYFCTQGGRNPTVNGRVYCVDGTTLRVKWCRRLRAKTTSSPAYADGRLFVSTYRGTVWAFDPVRGRVLWKAQPGGDFYGTPAVYGKRLIVASKSTGRVFCLAARSGKTVWWRKTKQGIYASPAVWRNTIFIGSRKVRHHRVIGGSFWAIDARNGALVWRKQYARPVYGSASVLGGVVYFSHTGHRTFGLDALTGKQLWSFPDGRYSPVTATSDMIIVTGRCTLYAFPPQQ
jgi:outer membrane protein assembly factor BamB